MLLDPLRPSSMKVARQLVERPFGKEQSLELPERAHRSLETLSELRPIFDDLYELAGNPTKPVTRMISHRPAATSAS
jgi:hypothetical protein